MTNPACIFKYNNIIPSQGPVIYWMQRDQRVDDNRALTYACEKAIEFSSPLLVVFCLQPGFLGASRHHFRFMLEGLLEVSASLKRLNIGFMVIKGDPGVVIPMLAEAQGSGLLITDFNPLRHVSSWKARVAKEISIAFHEVDAHNIIPARHISQKAEFGAHTLRKKAEKLLASFLDVSPPVKRHPHSPISDLHLPDGMETVILEDEIARLRKEPDIFNIVPGEKAAASALERFLSEGLENYNPSRNDPNAGGQSGLSPYLHFGQISALRIASEALKLKAGGDSVRSFLDELIVRRELSDNFCLYNPLYDSFEGLQPWAKKTLNTHREDSRPYVYELSSFDGASTHDPLWNAAQRELQLSGKMHGYLRMYWAKKILEWTPSPEEAIAIAIHLNDRYSLDGRDPNGYAGISWSIGGTHDRAWRERPVFGMIRYMNYQGCLRKFDVDRYIGKWTRG